MIIKPESFSMSHLSCVACNLPIPPILHSRSFFDAQEFFPLGMSGNIREKTVVARGESGTKNACVFDLIAQRSFNEALYETKYRHYEPLWRNEGQILTFLELYPNYLHPGYTFFPFTVPEDFTDEENPDQEEDGKILPSPYVARVYGRFPELGLHVYRFEHPYRWDPTIRVRFIIPQISMENV